MQVTNQRPAVLDPLYVHDYTKPFQPIEEMKAHICTQLRQPLVAGAPVTIADDAGNTLDDDAICGMVARCCGENIDVAAEDWCKELFVKTLAHFNPHGIGIQSLFSAQAAVKSKLPYATPTMVYTIGGDIIPTCREFMTGQCSPEKLFTVFAFYGRVDTLGFYFVNDVAFDQFKDYLTQQSAPIFGMLPPETQNLVNEFKLLKLNSLTESLLLRNSDTENTGAMSFARFIIAMLLNYGASADPKEFGCMPFRLSELYVPRTLLFINVERHMHASPKQIENEWSIIRQSLTMPPPIISNQKLTKLTTGVRSARKIMQQAVTADRNRMNPQKAPMVPFTSAPPRPIDLARSIRRVVTKMASVNRSDNSYKSIKMTFQKPNRRNPDDFNKQGKSVSTKYYADVHLYIDTSGSISEENYKDVVMMCIFMARKLNINIYFNTFSTSISQCTKLHLENRSTKQIYTAFQKVPKVTGGTDFSVVWDYINASKKRLRELSIMITDFEWTPGNRQVSHPKHLYYVPCANLASYTDMVHYAERFCKACEHIDPDMRSRLLF